MRSELIFGALNHITIVTSSASWPPRQHASCISRIRASRIPTNDVLVRFRGVKPGSESRPRVTNSTQSSSAAQLKRGLLHLHFPPDRTVLRNKFGEIPLLEALLHHQPPSSLTSSLHPTAGEQ